MNPPEEVLRRALVRARTVAVVGLSDKPERDSNEAARYLQAHGYRVVPVNPMVREVLGERSYSSLGAIPPEVTIDIVDVFRRSEEVGPIMDEAVARNVPVVWMQLGVSNAEAAKVGRTAGLTVVEDRCIMSDHRRMAIPPPGAPP
ncbi:MAG: CoA-binding protein [Thermoplasmata archaeon]|nr:CoA-binding protein [Thermoplasmata archaeon]